MKKFGHKVTNYGRTVVLASVACHVPAWLRFESERYAMYLHGLDLRVSDIGVFYSDRFLFWANSMSESLLTLT